MVRLGMGEPDPEMRARVSAAEHLADAAAAREKSMKALRKYIRL